MNTEVKGKGPCKSCGKAPRKLTRVGPWCLEGMHITCWKKKESKKTDEAYRQQQQNREDLFKRALDGDPTLEVPEWMQALLASVRYRMMGDPDAKVDAKDIHTAFWSWNGLGPPTAGPETIVEYIQAQPQRAAFVEWLRKKQDASYDAVADTIEAGPSNH